MQPSVHTAAPTAQCRPFSSCSRCRMRRPMPVQCSINCSRQDARSGFISNNASQLPRGTPSSTSGAEPSRRNSLLQLGVLLAAAVAAPQPAQAAQQDTQRLLQAFQDAMTAPDLEAAEQAWSQAIEIAPDSGPAYSNRGTIRLQDGRWRDAKLDFLKALQLDAANGSKDNAALLNNLGNAEVALGDLTAAQRHFQQAATDTGLESIAFANLALVTFESGQNDEAVKAARQLLRRDASFLDMRCALTAFLWASGQRSEAEGEWERLQDAQDGVGGTLYNKGNAVSRVQNRWPPRATAALRAFISMSSEASAEGYDGKQHSYSFGAAAA